MIKKIFVLMCTVLVGVFGFAACTDTSSITVITREAGSGTRGAFFDIIGLEDEELMAKAVTEQSTGSVKQKVAADKTAIGYISLGSLDNTVKALKVGGVMASSENVINESYKLARPFMLVKTVSTTLSSAVSNALNAYFDFLNTKTAQDILSGEGYIVSNPSTVEYQKKSGENTLAAATLIIGGSTSIGPVMELLAASFMEIETDVTVTMQNVTGSSAGVSGATDGTLHIGMVSRALKDAEKTTFNNGVTLCLDGIAVIVHKDNNKVDNVTIAQLKEIYTGAITSFDKLS